MSIKIGDRTEIISVSQELYENKSIGEYVWVEYIEGRLSDKLYLKRIKRD